MRAKFIYEKFTADSDPIHDMGIGYEAQIADWLKTLGTYTKINIKNTHDVINQCIWSKKTDYLKWMIETRNDYDKNYVLDKCLSYGFKSDILDILIKKGARFENLEDKIQYVTDLKGKLITLTPEEKLTASAKKGNFDEFKDKVESGVPVTIGMINGVFKREWGYKGNAKGEYDKIKNYLKKNINNLEKIIHPKDHKKIDKIKNYLNLNAPVAKKYPNGYKIYRLLKYIDQNKVTSEREMSEFMYNLSHGANTYNYLTNPSYWKDGFPVLVSPRVAIRKGQYFLNSKGKADLEKMEAKFNKMKINAYI